ncbi:mannose-1-phosphate guanylyltransferase/mannose-6-phosphate isomerase [Patescibacteria group bacterium]|nr:mannose-1-phosphate guanylyltransferase/mannose-6-phosphate isomerase [Patescibacteria group bacterium]MBU1662996.1 mannose-1-phosphate guanylyltransferase/mannose-6-phosphate isomerase [Patescibacteria group bacterium]MBU1934180.1 mannose-1-phosphate guanylyltransferase/mannose-6-phosphate isomerase [Patescibacteria group bacterium]
MYSIILCGGSGTKLWPLSRKNFPKQFLSLYSDKSLLQETFLRINKLIPAENIILVTNKDNYFNAANQIKDVEPRFSKQNIIIEPASLNTAPAITLGVKYLLDQRKIAVNEPIIILPSDHYIGNQTDYLNLVRQAIAEIEDNIGTFGILPLKPNTDLGYIKKGEKIKSYYKAAEFKEKPDRQTAISYIESGEYLWNSGMYLFNCGTFVAEIKKHAPAIYNLFSKDYGEFYSEFAKMPSISFDFAVSEKSDKVIVFEGAFSWDDIDSFDNLAEISQTNGNHKPRHIGFDSKNIFIHSSNNRLIATLGVDDLIIIENNDSILIQKKGRSENVKHIVDYLKESKMKELEHNLIVHRPWGKYEILIDEPNHKVKKITVSPDSKLSLQAHCHRAEHWVAIKGIAKIVNGDKTIYLRENESTFIPAFTKHRLSNPGKINLELIEVQTGKYLEEDDIIRYEDIYDRE